tara:strand:+ start:377 stop:622 length:246 start_codon:yes stop_codon:yes gene_type:complete
MNSQKSISKIKGNPVPSLDNETKEWIKYYFKGFVSEEVIDDFIYKLEDKLENGVETNKEQPSKSCDCANQSQIGCRGDCNY